MKKYSKYLFLFAAIFCVAGFLLFFVSKLYGYAIFVETIGNICLLAGIILFVRYGNPQMSYESKVNGILNTFDSILVRSSSVPNLDGRNIVPVMSIDDLVDAQLEIRKQICYIKQIESCSFILLDEKEAYIYVEKMNDQVFSPVDIALRDLQIKNKNKDDLDSDLLKNIDKTTVVKLSNQKSYRVSPIRKGQKEEKKPEEKVKPEEKEIEILDKTRSIPLVKSKKKSFLEHTQVLEHLDEEVEVKSKPSVLCKDEVETL